MKITEYYSLENIVSWIKSIFYALFKPKCFAKEIESRSNSELLAQYSFYFSSCTVFYIFISVDFQKESLFKQSVLDLLINSSIFLPVLITTIILCKVERGKKVKIAFLYFLTIIFSFLPILLLLKAAFYGMEDYFYELVISIITVISLIYINYIIAIVLRSGWKSIVSFLALNYLLINVFLLGTTLFQFDRYAPQNINDRLFMEYIDLHSSLNCQDEIPTVLTYTGYKDNFKFGFALWNLLDTVSTKTDFGKIDLYRKQLDENIKMIDEKQFSFYRNKAIAMEYKHYFNEIKKTIEQVHTYPTDLREYGYKLDLMGLPIDTILVFSKQIEVDSIITKRNKLVEYYNEFMDNKEKSRYPQEVIYRLQYAPSILIMRLFYNKEK